MPQTDRPQIDRARWRAVLSLRGLRPADIAAAARVSVRHLDLVLAGHRPASERLRAAVVEVIGADGWRFVIGDTDTIGAPAAAEARP